MFNNLINTHDFLKIFEKIKAGRLKFIIKKIFSGKEQKIKDSWQHTNSPPTNWWNIPAVKERFNELISGDRHIDHRIYIQQKYLPKRKDLTALSLGCGTGQNEIAWGEMGIFNRLDAFDISESRISQAAAAAAGKGLDKVIQFSVADAQEIDPGESRYDLVLFEGSLHHFSPVGEILSKVNRSLKPEGFLVVFDFVGPSRFQWSRRQLEVVNGLLKVFPLHYRKKWQSRDCKTRVFRPGRLSMRWSDPSEAADSANILPSLKQIFEVVELKEMGGTILQLLFAGIAHHFAADDPRCRELVRICFAVEDFLMKTEDIPSDFVLAVCRKRGAAVNC